MNNKKLSELLDQEPFLTQQLQKVAKELNPPTRGGIESIISITLIASLYPLISFVIKNIGLPWLLEAQRFSDLWRIKFHEWVDNQYTKHDLDPQAIKAAGDVLKKELESLDDRKAQIPWERLVKIIEEDISDKEE